MNKVRYCPSYHTCPIINPGETTDFDYYPLGALSGQNLSKVSIDIEQMLYLQDEKFIKELPKE